jgi:hypothetical protein
VNREAGKGPFSVPKEVLPLPAADRQGGPLLPVIDAAGETFCYVGLMDCHGRDLAAAKARARRIAESLNKTEGFGGSQPVPYVAEDGALMAPEGFCFEVGGEGEITLAPLLSFRGGSVS